LDPTIKFSPVNDVIIDNDIITVVTSNVSDGSTSGFSMAFSSIAQKQQSKAYAAFNIAPNEAIADLGATQIFVMEGTPVLNKTKDHVSSQGRVGQWLPGTVHAYV
jgi:hypothetical protein